MRQDLHDIFAVEAAVAFWHKLAAPPGCRERCSFAIAELIPHSPRAGVHRAIDDDHESDSQSRTSEVAGTMSRFVPGRIVLKTQRSLLKTASRAPPPHFQGLPLIKFFFQSTTRLFVIEKRPGRRDLSIEEFRDESVRHELRKTIVRPGLGERNPQAVLSGSRNEIDAVLVSMCIGSRTYERISAAFLCRKTPGAFDYIRHTLSRFRRRSVVVRVTFHESRCPPPLPTDRAASKLLDFIARASILHRSSFARSTLLRWSILGVDRGLVPAKILAPDM